MESENRNNVTPVVMSVFLLIGIFLPPVLLLNIPLLILRAWLQQRKRAKHESMGA